MEFYKILEKIMQSKNLSIPDVARSCGLTDSTVRSIFDRKQKKIALNVAFKLSDGLGVSLAQLNGTEKIEIDEKNFNKHTNEEDILIKKYRILDGYGKQAVDSILDIEYNRALEAQKQSSQQELVSEAPVLFYPVPEYSEPVSAGTGKPIDIAYPENIMLIKEPPRGTSFIAHVKGESMEPTFQDGDMVFVHAQNEIKQGQIGIFFMDGQEFIKELGDGELISHNPNFDCIEIDESVRCQGLVMGICDESYLED